MGKKWILLIIGLSLFLISVSGCALQKYKKCELLGEDYRFTFEYPASYRMLERGKRVYCIRSLRGDKWTDSWFWVTVDEAGKPDNARELLDEDAASFSSSEHYMDFKIIKREQAVIAGIEGELCVFSYYNPHTPILGPLPGTSLKLPASMVKRHLYFNYKGYICKIKVNSIQETAEEVDEDFEHLINTFKIIE